MSRPSPVRVEADDLRGRHLYGRAVAGARLGVLDVGAGTGRVTVTGLLRSR